jgi:hypothetical protein
MAQLGQLTKFSTLLVRVLSQLSFFEKALSSATLRQKLLIICLQSTLQVF